MAFGSVGATRGLHLCGAHSSLAVNITKKSNNLRRKFGLTPSTVDRELGTRARAALGAYLDTDHCSSGACIVYPYFRVYASLPSLLDTLGIQPFLGRQQPTRCRENCVQRGSQGCLARRNQCRCQRHGVL